MFAMIKAGGIEPTAASALGFCVGALVKYILNYFLAFRSTQPHRAATIRFVAATGALLGLNTAIFWVLQSGVGVHYAAAQLIATGLVVPIGYVVSRYWVFE